MASAPPSDSIRILHLADVHCHSRLVRRMAERVGALPGVLAAHSPVDLVCITGDLTRTGDPEEFTLFEASVVAPLVEHLGVRREQIVLVPGNHDVFRPSIDHILQRGVQTLLTQPDQLDETWRSRQPDLTKRLEHFTRYCTTSGI